MPIQRFLISNIKSGQVNNPDPWLIMDDAWAKLQNVHTFRGKVIKRIGAQEMDTSQTYNVRQLFTRLRIKIGTTDAITGNLAGTVPGATFAIGQMFSIGTAIYTVYQTGTPATMLQTVVTTTATYNTTTGAYVFVGAPVATDVYFYPATPVMALPSYQNITLNNEQLVAFDTQFAYAYTSGAGWNILGPVPPAANSGLWTGTDSAFHWTANWRGASGFEYLFFVVNNTVADQIQYYNGTNWTKIQPIYDSSPMVPLKINTARIVIPFKGRLLLMNTDEQIGAGHQQFTNRIRYSQIGDPTDATNSWDQNQVGRGGFIDLTIREQITSAQYLKDRLIIFCERSTWELVYTGNEVLPFRPQQINIELGVESQNSLVTFDKQVIGFGSTGIHSCNGMNVARIDDQIPDNIFTISNSNAGPQRVCAIRDYFSEEIYWSYPESANSTTYPNQFIVYNYKNGAWAFNFDSITALGYYQATANVTWASLTSTWAGGDEQWADPADIALYRGIVAGNQEGFTFVMTHTSSSNSLSLSITNISITNNMVTFTVINHNLLVGDWINIQNIGGTTGVNSTVLNYRVDTVTDANTFSVIILNVAGAYTGGGTVSRVSLMYLQSKQYNFFKEVGRRMHIPRIDFLIDAQGNYAPVPPPNVSAIALDFLASFSGTNFIVQGGSVTGANIGTYILDMSPQNNQENSQEMLWRSMYPLLEGDVCQVVLSNSQRQMASVVITSNDFRLHAMVFHARPISAFGY